jgi:hypothetical protein
MHIPLQTKLITFEARTESASNWHLFARHWQHARGLRLALTSIRPTLETCSGAASRIGVHPSWSWRHARVLRLALPSTSSTVLRLLRRLRFDLFRLDSNITYHKYLTTTSPTTRIQQHHHDDSSTMRLHRPRHARISFGALTRDMQDYDVKARLESLPDSTNRLDTRGLLMKELQMGPRYLPTWFLFQERSPLEGYKKPARPNTPIWSRRQKLLVNPNWLHI